LGAQGTQHPQSRCAVEIFQSRTNHVIPKECAGGTRLSQGDLCGLEFDPILGSQDFDDHLDFKLHITEATPPQTGRFEARFKLFNEQKPEQEQVLIFQLVQLKNGWRIDDITYTKHNTTLKAVITAILKEAEDLKPKSKNTTNK